ncbi:OLC1v1033699C1 [Oldenlandia corymbosa var. corymbosa]|uniref:non-specific serine/threonine protein kinase n=1 Tax=Oldenlandia corymbosa var. corymbosa TaxID=529605 RepID=A0AAV1CQ49_OLDCO|nr:OLC1v1033699C1 [Oldenlandia corymbosa var. corymbosa]
MLVQQVLVVWILTANLLIGVDPQGFIYNGFQSAKTLSLDGIAEFTNNGLLMLTNSSYDTPVQTGHAFYQHPINFNNSSSFSTTFVFAIRSEIKTKSAQGLAFVIAPTKDLPGGRSYRFLGLFNESNDGNSSNRIFGVEFDTFQNSNANDIDDNHVGIDIDSINSVQQAPAGYYSDDDDGEMFDNITLMSGDPIQAWVDYDGIEKQIMVTLAPVSKSSAPKRPSVPLVNLTYDLSPVLQQAMYVGFSSSTSAFVVNHYILGWSFQAGNSPRQLELDISRLPKLPILVSPKKKVPIFLLTGVPLICIFSVLLAVLSVIYYIRRKRKFAEVLEDWEVAYGPHRFNTAFGRATSFADVSLSAYTDSFQSGSYYQNSLEAGSLLSGGR